MKGTQSPEMDIKSDETNLMYIDEIKISDDFSGGFYPFGATVWGLAWPGLTPKLAEH